jgi:hypothetical protein
MVKYKYERLVKNAAADTGVNARNCKIPEVYSYSDDTTGYIPGRRTTKIHTNALIITFLNNCV